MQIKFNHIWPENDCWDWKGRKYLRFGQEYKKNMGIPDINQW